jgi:hypothetical protein
MSPSIPLIFSSASLLFCGFFFIYFRRYIRRRTSHDSILADCEDAVARLEAQIDAITDRDAQLVEERIKNLKKLLENVDRRISLLSRIEDQRKPAEVLYNFPGNRIPFPGPAALNTESGDKAFSGPGPVDTPLTPPPAPEDSAPASVPEYGEDTRSLVDRAAELDRAGLSPKLIASRLGVSVSEAELAVTVSRHSRPAPSA